MSAKIKLPFRVEVYSRWTSQYSWWGTYGTLESAEKFIRECGLTEPNRPDYRIIDRRTGEVVKRAGQ